jgi:hypothetical protein
VLLTDVGVTVCVIVNWRLLVAVCVTWTWR